MDFIVLKIIFLWKCSKPRSGIASFAMSRDSKRENKRYSGDCLYVHHRLVLGRTIQ